MSVYLRSKVDFHLADPCQMYVVVSQLALI